MKYFNSKLSYNTKVKTIKVGLISIFILTILVFLVSPIMFLKFKDAKSAIASAIISKILTNNITPPVLSGGTKNGGSYYLSADKVTNNLFDFNQNNASAIILTNPFLLYSSKDKLVFNVSSSEAVVNSTSKNVNMSHTVSITSNAGHAATLQNANIDLLHKSLSSNKPLTASYQNARLSAAGVTINNFGDIIKLKGPVIIYAGDPALVNK